MTMTLNPTTTPTVAATPSPTRAWLAATPVWRVGAVAGVVAAAATTVVALVAKAADIPMMAAPKSAEVARTIPLSGFAVSTLMCTAIGTILAVVLARRATRSAATFVVITIVLTLASFAGPATTGYATTATRLVLDLTHVVAAAIVIPALAWRLARRV